MKRGIEIRKIDRQTERVNRNVSFTFIIPKREISISCKGYYSIFITPTDRSMRNWK